MKGLPAYLDCLPPNLTSTYHSTPHDDGMALSFSLAAMAFFFSFAVMVLSFSFAVMALSFSFMMIAFFRFCYDCVLFSFRRIFFLG